MLRCFSQISDVNINRPRSRRNVVVSNSREPHVRTAAPLAFSGPEKRRFLLLLSMLYCNTIHGYAWNRFITSTRHVTSMIVCCFFVAQITRSQHSTTRNRSILPTKRPVSWSAVTVICPLVWPQLGAFGLAPPASDVSLSFSLICRTWTEP